MSSHTPGKERPGRRIRELIYAALFGALWGALEITVGSYLHTLLPPGTAPLVGPVMAAIGLTVALIGRHFAPYRGSLLLMGAVAALLKVIGPGTVRWGPLLGILIEAGSAELVLLLARRPRRVIYVIAAAVAVASTLGQRFLLALIFAEGLGTAWRGMIYEGGKMVGLTWAAAILGILLAVNLALGALAGELAWEVGRGAERRLARRWEEPTP